jgi:hypothetical protein
MAVLKFGSIVTEGSGSLGGHTIQHSKGGMQLRTKPIPHGNPSTSQLLIRSFNQQMQQGWQALTPSQQKIWNDWPAAHGIMNAKGDHRPLSGHSLWMKYNYTWLAAGGGFLPYPSYWGGPIYGPNLFKNGNFNSSLNWTLSTTWSISGGLAHYLKLINSWMKTPLSVSLNEVYILKFTISNCAGIAQISYYSNMGAYTFKAPYNFIQYLPSGDHLFIVTGALNVTQLWVYGYATGPTYDLDNLSLQKLL